MKQHSTGHAHNKLSIPTKSDGLGSYYHGVSWWVKDVMQQVKFIIIGAGALGNEVAKNLALLDARNMTIVDIDTIEYSNLTRSVLFSDKDLGSKKAEVLAREVHRLNPDANVEAIHGDVIYGVGLGYFQEADVILCCVDNRLARLFINRYAFLFDKTWINGSIENLMGRLEVYQRDLHCYESNLTELEWQHIRYRMGCADVARRSESVGRIATTPISASIIGAMQVQEALKVVHGYDKQLASVHSLFYDGWSGTYLEIKNTLPNPDTQSRLLASQIVSAPFSHKDTLGTLRQWMDSEHNVRGATFMLRHDLVLEAICEPMNITLDRPIPAQNLMEYFAKIAPQYIDEEIFIINQTNRISERQLDQMSMAELGIPDRDILHCMHQGNSLYIKLQTIETSTYSKTNKIHLKQTTES